MNKPLCLFSIILAACSPKTQSGDSKLDSLQLDSGQTASTETPATGPKVNWMEAPMSFYFSDSTIAAKDIAQQVYSEKDLQELSDSTWTLYNYDYYAAFQFEGEVLESSGACTPHAVLLFARGETGKQEFDKTDWILISKREDGGLMASLLNTTTYEKSVVGSDTTEIDNALVWDFPVKKECNVLAKQTNTKTTDVFYSVRQSQHMTFYSLDNKKLNEILSVDGTAKVSTKKTNGLFDLVVENEGSAAESYKWDGAKYQPANPGQ